MTITRMPSQAFQQVLQTFDFTSASSRPRNNMSVIASPAFPHFTHCTSVIPASIRNRKSSAESYHALPSDEKSTWNIFERRVRVVLEMTVLIVLSRTPGWRNWQTRRTQNPVL